MSANRQARFGAVIVAALLPSAASGYEGGPVSDGGKIVGTVSYAGPPFKVAALKVTKDNARCGTSKPSEELVVGASKALRYAVISIKKIERGKVPPAQKPVLDQHMCVYIPHVQAALLGSALEIRNSDPVLHNVHGVHGEERTAFNLAMPIEGQRIKRKLKNLGPTKVICDAGHTWMSAYVLVFDHPYFSVSDAKGKFGIGDVPAGTYELEVWHEKLKPQTQKVTVSKGKSTVANFSLK